MTDKQKQHLLAYLGYYTGEVDGIFGRQSVEATKAFQTEVGLEADGVAGIDTEKALRHAVTYGMPGRETPRNFWDDVKHFDRDEFRCKCGGRYCDGFPVEPSKKLVKLADSVREHFGAAAIISSGVRCETHNAHVGGVSGSRHKYGTAMDFRIKGIPATTLLEYVWKQPETNYAYAIDEDHIHMDVI